MDTKPVTFFIAGVQHRTGDFGPDAFIAAVPTFPCACDIIGEPKNQYDKYAVKVCVGPYHLGYVPKPVNIDVWGQHTLGMKATGTILEHNPDMPPWQRFRVQIVFTKK